VIDDDKSEGWSGLPVGAPSLLLSKSIIKTTPLIFATLTIIIISSSSSVIGKILHNRHPEEQQGG